MAVRTTSPDDVQAAPRGRRIRVPDAVLTFLLAVAALLAAEVIANLSLISEIILPAPSQVAMALWDGIIGGPYLSHLSATALVAAAGFAISVCLALIIAGVLVSFNRLENVVLPFVVAFQALPKIAVAPLVVLWLGFGVESKLAIVVIVSFFPMLMNTLQGLRIRDEEQLFLMQTLGARKLSLFRLLRIPNALPYIFAGLRIGVIFAVIGAIVAEFVGSRPGLGYLIMIQKSQFNVPGIFAVLFILMLMGITFERLIRFAERRIAFWAEDLGSARVPS